MTKSLTPNALLPSRTMSYIILGEISAAIFLWAFLTPAIIPKPLEILESLEDLWAAGITRDLLTSLGLYAESLLAASILSLAIAYSSAIPIFRPIAEAYSKLRFAGMVGFPFLFTIYIHSAHGLKLALLTFSISTFLVTSLLDVVDQIPKEKYDLARTLQMSEWEVLWEVVILGRIDIAFDVIRQNAAIGWMMLPMIEGLFKSEGGIGVVLDIDSHHFRLAEIAAIQLIVLAIGLGQDYLIGWIKSICCPYASLLLERR